VSQFSFFATEGLVPMLTNRSETKSQLGQVLLVAEPGVASGVVESALRARGYDVLVVGLEHPDLFSCAVGRRAVVVLPTRNLLSAGLAQQTNCDTMKGVLRAAGAPGVELVVVALPAAPHFDGVVDAVERHGKPYVVLRAPGLLEEVAEALRPNDARHDRGTLWLPRAGEVPVARGSALADAVADALETEEQGRVRELSSESFDVAGLFAAASGLGGAPVRVRPVQPLVYRMVRPVARWLKGGEPPLLALADQLLARPQAPHSSGTLLST
jgi:hypothetical protein